MLSAFGADNRLPFEGASVSVLVWPRDLVDMSAKIKRPHLVISMTEHSNFHAKYPHNSQRVGLMPLHIDDIIGNDLSTYADRIISTEQADLIVERVLSSYALGVKLFVCQCEAGISRSAAVAQAIYERFNEPSPWFEEQFAPNQYILKMLRESFQRSIDLEVRHCFG